MRGFVAFRGNIEDYQPLDELRVSKGNGHGDLATHAVSHHSNSTLVAAGDKPGNRVGERCVVVLRDMRRRAMVRQIGEHYAIFACQRAPDARPIIAGAEQAVQNEDRRSDSHLVVVQSQIAPRLLVTTILPPAAARKLQLHAASVAGEAPSPPGSLPLERRTERLYRHHMKPSVPERLAARYYQFKTHPAAMTSPGYAIEITAEDRIGLIADITAVISELKGDVGYFQSWIDFDRRTHLLIQLKADNGQSSADEMERRVSAVPGVAQIRIRPLFSKTFGKRVIVMGGGAQVAAVASGAIAEADRHNIRGELISVDTIALVGEHELAEAVRAVGRLHRVGVLVLAGSLMGGEIASAVTELREEYGIPVISLKMAGSINRYCDLVVTDPTAAGVMATMLISNVGRFDLLKLHGECY